MTTVTSDMVADALAALPTEPADIATLFGELGISGDRSNADSCPVAHFLVSELPSITGASVYALAFVDLHDASAVHALTPQHVFAFIEAFDRGDYPDLVA